MIAHLTVLVISLAFVYMFYRTHIMRYAYLVAGITYAYVFAGAVNVFMSQNAADFSLLYGNVAVCILAMFILYVTGKPKGEKEIDQFSDEAVTANGIDIELNQEFEGI